MGTPFNTCACFRRGGDRNNRQCKMRREPRITGFSFPAHAPRILSFSSLQCILTRRHCSLLRLCQAHPHDIRCHPLPHRSLRVFLLLQIITNSRRHPRTIIIISAGSYLHYLLIQYTAPLLLLVLPVLGCHRRAMSHPPIRTIMRRAFLSDKRNRPCSRHHHPSPRRLYGKRHFKIITIITTTATLAAAVGRLHHRHYRHHGHLRRQDSDAVILLTSIIITTRTITTRNTKTKKKNNKHQHGKNEPRNTRSGCKASIRNSWKIWKRKWFIYTCRVLCRIITTVKMTTQDIH